MSARARLKTFIKDVYGSYIRKRYRFTTSDFQKVLRLQGVSPGDVLLVHSSFNRCEAFVGQPSDMINALLDVVTEEGTLLMPTMSFTGSALDYVENQTHFDLRYRPSRMGLLSEVFRRRKGIVRSVHPTHSMACYGRLADEIAVDHHTAATPCGNPSPYSKLLAYDGKILFIGTGIGTMTFFHYLEEELESQLPYHPFTDSIYQLETTGLNGKRWCTTTRLFAPATCRRRMLGIVKRELRKAAHWNERRIGNVRTILLSARQVASCCRSAADSGILS